MKTVVVWKEGMEFSGVAGSHSVTMDAKPPIGKGAGATPKELVAMGLGGCTAIDVIALLKKYKQLPQSFSVDIEIQTSAKGFPAVFEKAMITFAAEGEVDPTKLLEAVKLSQTTYCGVSAMLAKAFPIEYRVILNGSEIGRGLADFESNKKEIA